LRAHGVANRTGEADPFAPLHFPGDASGGGGDYNSSYGQPMPPPSGTCSPNPQPSPPLLCALRPATQWLQPLLMLGDGYLLRCAKLTVAAIRTGYYGQPPPGTYGAPPPTSYLGPPASTYGGAPPGSYGAPPPATMYGGAPMSGYAGGVGGGGGVSFDPYGSGAGGWGQPPASGAIAFDPSSYRPADEPIPFDPSSYTGPYPSSGGGWSQPQPPPTQAPTSYYGGAPYQQQPQPPPTQMVLNGVLVLKLSCLAQPR
jgi:hypothetical protein